jgi:hypothetical protein
MACCEEIAENSEIIRGSGATGAGRVKISLLPRQHKFAVICESHQTASLSRHAASGRSFAADDGAEETGGAQTRAFPPFSAVREGSSGDATGRPGGAFGG